MTMPASSGSSVPVTPDSSSSLKSFDLFQRRKIGSIRDNPKLFKIRQQFENACKDDTDSKAKSKDQQDFLFTSSAPSSLNFSSRAKKTNNIPLHELFKQNATSGNIKDVFNTKQLLNVSRRHSEGETTEPKTLSHLKEPGRLSVDTSDLRSVTDTNRLNSYSSSSASVSQLSSAQKIKSFLSHDTRTDYSKSFNKYGTCVKRDENISSDNNYNRLQFLPLQKTSSDLKGLSTKTQKLEECDQYSSRNSSIESGVHTCCSASEEESLVNSSSLLSIDLLSQSCGSLDLDDKPPPIPRRGLSMPIGDAIQDQTIHIMQKTKPSSTSYSTKTSSTLSSSPKNVIKENSVKKTILIYEGLSTGETKSNRAKKISNYPKHILKKDQLPNCNIEYNGRKITVHRRSSRRNSIRRSKGESSDKDSSKLATSKLQKTKKESSGTFKHSKEDSGVGFSDFEDLNKLSPSEAIYQTLCGVNHTSEFYDPYDRLNRIHDVVNRTHKGQSSTCAACKTIPSSNLTQLTRNPNSTLLQVKCNEMSPHHHPPCICFFCQHSTFSCLQNGNESNHEVSSENSAFIDDQESLYYNVCCLNGPSCESWRQSRRRPVCEQNGRLCVVNCDMENRAQAKDDEFYEKLSEWQSVPVETRTNHSGTQTSKHLSGDSCDSDEGWVDITDSEDERTIECLHHNSKANDARSSQTLVKQPLSRKCSDSLSVQNASYNVEKQSELYSKLNIENISRSTSSEHLYETIADIEAQSNVDKEDYANRDAYNSDLQNKNDTSNDNDPDSGEWSTESSSPVLGESSNHNSIEEKVSSSSTYETSAQTRFTHGSDFMCQDGNAKKTFIKSVLGKKQVNSKKRRMSNFFVPWLVSNHEYGTSRSPKLSIKKQVSAKGSRTFTKSKRSHSTPSCASGSSLSCTKAVFSSTEILDRCKSDMKELEQTSDEYSERSLGVSIDSVCALSQRGSLASSTYLSPDQLQSVPAIRTKPSISESAALDVTVHKIFRRSTSGESDHTYILFQPIKEEDVPLYQFYERNIKERVALCRSPDSSMSPVMWSSAVGSSTTHDCSFKSPLRSQLSVVEQLSPDAKEVKMLWCELPEVKESGILEQISAQELKLQEAAFEFIQSQASYIRSLKVLFENFIQAPEFSDSRLPFCILSKHEHDVLFSDIIGVKAVSERLMSELTARWSDGILIPDICDIIYRHATAPSFSIYIKYCSNRVYQEKTLKELKETRLCFLEILRKLESNPACQGLSLESFLFLPMQHIARLPLLLDNIFRWLGPDSPSFNVCKMALEAVHKIFMECNEGARKMERLEEMFVLNKQLEFKECKVIPLISASRWLLKKGELMKLEFDKKTFGRSSRCIRVPLYIFLFNDLLVITKRKNEDSYFVVDYCLREKVQAKAVDAKDLQQPVVVPDSCRYLIYLTLFSNHQGSTVDMILNCALLSERTRWLEAIHPIAQKKSEVWEYDHPQVQCVRSYIAQQPDELSLQESDVVTINRKMNDGWYEGRRLRDGSQGWFPASYTMDIPCSRARASNLRQCYRLLMLSQKHEERTN